ncbi:MAG: DegT/DnrJ/EryC1/StrS aminotransferase family protein [Burkholderiales bacterium]|nr:DegT/DnrJ/EryC1/StrS aminotransferase family protein [Burkholderiales bacterium]
MEWKVPLFDPDIGEAEIAGINEVLRSKWLTMGERTTRFEERFSELVGVPHAIALNSATAALHLALAALDIGPGDDVVLPSLTFVATANAVRYCGARPVFADIESYDCWNVSAASIEAALTPATCAIVVVHYAGYPCDMPAITKLARERGLAVVEDAAHAPGGSLAGRAMGAWSDAGCFSFFSNKNMTTAEGGMLTTARADVAERVRKLRSHGMTTLTLDRHKGHAFSYDVVSLGYNYRMSELNAALGLAQLDRLGHGNAQRRRHVARYRERLAGIAGLSAPFAQFAGEATYHIMPVLLPRAAVRAEVMKHMMACGIQTSIHYRPIDTFSAYVAAGLGPSATLPLTHDVGARGLTLPLYPGLSEQQVDYICASLSDALSAAERAA